jgi:hypothetical protein
MHFCIAETQAIDGSPFFVGGIMENLGCLGLAGPLNVALRRQLVDKNEQ